MNHIPVADQDLWDGCRSGNSASFGILFDRHADALFRFCRSTCGSWHDAEELVSIAFLEAWRKRGTITLEHDSLLPWLIGVASNANLNRRRTLKRHSALIAKLPRDEATTAFELRVDEELDAWKETTSLMDNAGLSRPERSVAVLCLMYGYQYADAATMLGTPVGTVRSRLNRARKKLKAAAASPPHSSYILTPEASQS